MSATKDWMDRMRLKLNEEKTEFILMGNEVQLKKTVTKVLNVNDEQIPVSNNVRCLGAWINKNINFCHHVKIKAKTAMYKEISD